MTFKSLRLIQIAITAVILAAISGTIPAQGTLNRQTGSITFFSSTPVEDIKAVNTTFTSTISLADSTVVFTVPIAGFIFRKKLMQEHFNEQYMESSRFPNARFRGKLTLLPQTGTGAVPLKSRIRGTLTIRDISRKIDEPVTFIPAFIFRTESALSRDRDRYRRTPVSVAVQQLDGFI